MQVEKKPIALVFGSTGKSGFHIANQLLDDGYSVRIYVRSKKKAQKLFQNQLARIEEIVEGSLDDDSMLETAFKASSNGDKVKIVVSALGAGVVSKQQVEQLEYTNQLQILRKCENHGVQRYVLICAALIERPWHPIAFILNCLVPNVFYWKVKLENDIRKSSLNYTIIRPPELYGDINNTDLTGYKLDQGEKILGRISRKTLAKIVSDSLKSNNIKSRVTFQCAQIPQNKQNQQLISFQDLQSDPKDKVITADHKKTKLAWQGILFLLFTGSIVGLFHYFRSQ